MFIVVGYLCLFCMALQIVSLISLVKYKAACFGGVCPINLLLVFIINSINLI